MKIISAAVLTGQGTDRVYLKTDLPPALWPHTENVSLSFEVARGNGIEYVKANFNLDAELIDRGVALQHSRYSDIP